MKKKNDICGDQEFENELKEKLNELSSSVDCFDKISARAFPEKDSDFSDSEFVVSDLENVTGRRKIVPVLKWTAAAAAVGLCVGILPKTAFVHELMSNFSKDADRQYSAILAEISKETEEHTYKIYDMPLDDYIRKDVLITPLYSCPFKESNRDDINVRIYVRTIFGDIPTNQIYAVEYEGDYSSARVLAAAESEAKITDEDIESIDERTGFYDPIPKTENAVNTWFRGAKTDDVCDREENIVHLASFSRNDYFKLNDEILYLTTDVIYNSIDGDSSGVYYYDIACYNNNSESVDIPGSEKLWKKSLKYNGSSAMPEKNSSLFVRRDYFTDDVSGSSVSPLCYYEPYANEELTDVISDHLGIMKRVSEFKKDKYDFELDTPADAVSKENMRIYISGIIFLAFSSYSDARIEISVNDSVDPIKIGINDIRYCSQTMSEVESEREYDAVKRYQDNRSAELERQVQKEIDLEAKEAEKNYKSAATR